MITLGNTKGLLKNTYPVRLSWTEEQTSAVMEDLMTKLPKKPSWISCFWDSPLSNSFLLNLAEHNLSNSICIIQFLLENLQWLPLPPTYLEGSDFFQRSFPSSFFPKSWSLLVREPSLVRKALVKLHAAFCAPRTSTVKSIDHHYLQTGPSHRKLIHEYTTNTPSSLLPLLEKLLFSQR